MCKGNPLLTMYAANAAQADEAEQRLRKAISISEEKPDVLPLIRRKITTDSIR